MGVFKRIHNLDESDSISLSDRLVVDSDLNGAEFKTTQIQFKNLKKSILTGRAFKLLLETGDSLLSETGNLLLLEQSYSGAFENIIEGPGTTLELKQYYRITSAGTYNLPAASTNFDTTTQARIKIKNISGGSITIAVNGSDIIRDTTGNVTSINVLDGEFFTIICASLSEWDAN